MAFHAYAPAVPPRASLASVPIAGRVISAAAPPTIDETRLRSLVPLGFTSAAFGGRPRRDGARTASAQGTFDGEAYAAPMPKKPCEMGAFWHHPCLLHRS